MKHILSAAVHRVLSNASIPSYLTKMGRQYTGLTPLPQDNGHRPDCRSVVVLALRKREPRDHSIYIVGLEDTPIHVLTVDASGHKATDSFNGKLLGDQYHLTTASGPEVLDVIFNITVANFLRKYA